MTEIRSWIAELAAERDLRSTLGGARTVVQVRLLCFVSMPVQIEPCHTENGHLV